MESGSHSRRSHLLQRRATSRSSHDAPPLPDGPNRSPTGLGRAGSADIRDYLSIAPPNLGARQGEQSVCASTSDRTSSPSLTVGLLLAMADERGVWGADGVSKNWRQETDAGLFTSKSKSKSKSIRRVTNDRFRVTAESALRLLATVQSSFHARGPPDTSPCPGGDDLDCDRRLGAIAGDRRANIRHQRADPGALHGRN